MKLFRVNATCLLTGCIFGQSSEVKRAEKILHNFECKMLRQVRLQQVQLILTTNSL